jgi:small-conductance mechanosensitive channel/CRP-like cAMP-binding protein
MGVISMGYWSNLQHAAGMPDVRGYHWVVIGFLVSAGVLTVWSPEGRKRIAGATTIFGLSVVGMLVAAAVATWGGRDTTAYKWIRPIALLLEGMAIINLAGVLLFRVALRAIRLEPPPIVRDLLLAIAYIVLLLGLLSHAGVNLTGIVATSAVATAVIAFSLQDTLGNVMGGMVLQLERSIAPGDWIRVDQQEGMVKEIRWRQTSLETRNWDTIIIPNSQLMKSQVTILGRRTNQPRQNRQWVYFNVDYRYSPTEVIEAVETALRAEPIPNVATEPLPQCIMHDFKDSYGMYAVRYWLTDLSANDPTNSMVRARIFTALKRVGISPSIPAQTLFITEDSEERRHRKTSEEAERRLQAMRGVELFAPLTEEELRQLAGRLRVAPFVRGEAITRQGAHANWLYMLIKGHAEVRVRADGDNGEASQMVATLKEGSFFGEMGLLTGAPRSATVVAKTDVLCYRLDKEAFIGVLKKRPELAEAISQILARRRSELEAVREGLNEQAARMRARSAQQDILQRIRNFFTLDL